MARRSTPPVPVQPAPPVPARRRPGAVRPAQRRAVRRRSLYTVTGTVASPALPGVAGLTVQLVDKNVGGDQVLATTQTGGDGSYGFTGLPIARRYLARAPQDRSPTCRPRCPAGGQFLAASPVSYSAPMTVTLNVVLPAGCGGPAQRVRDADGEPGRGLPGQPGALQEGNGRSDITYLANKTGWDARAVALAALADQFSQITAPADRPGARTRPRPRPGRLPTVSLQPEFYYALFRAGLPASADSLFQASPATVQAIWQQATSQGVIPQSLAEDMPGRGAELPGAERGRCSPPPRRPGVSTLQEMLQPTLPEQRSSGSSPSSTRSTRATGPASGRRPSRRSGARRPRSCS